MLNQIIKPALIIFGITLPLWLVFRVIVIRYGKKHKPLSVKHELIWFAFYVYVTCVLIITVVPLPFTRYDPELNRINLIPLVNTIKEFTATLSKERNFMMEHSLGNIAGNIILFVPLGIFLPFISSKSYSVKKIILVSFLSSLSIELIQLVSGYFGSYRSVDIDDIILNMLGAVLGFILAGGLLKTTIK